MNRALTLGLIVLLAIFIGVTITVQQTNNPILLSIATQQSEILDLLKKIDRLAIQQKAPEAEVAGSATAEDIQNIGQKLAVLDQKLSSLTETVKALSAPQQPQQRPTPPPEDYTTVFEIPIDHSAIKGNKDAPITIVAFEDLQCPFCARFRPAVYQVLEAYPGKVKFIMKHYPLPFHAQARPASKAVFAAWEQGKYWEMIDLISANFSNLSDEKYKEFAKQLKLNEKKFLKDLANNDAKYEGWINADLELGNKVGVRGTPTFYLNGRKTGARDLDAYKKAIDAILNEQK